MKLKDILGGVVLFLVINIVINCFAVSNTETGAEGSKNVPPVELSADVNNLVFTGVIKKLPEGTALVTEKATYLLSGGNFDAIVGKEVNIIGKIIKEGSIEKIDVSRAQLAHE